MFSPTWLKISCLLVARCSLFSYQYSKIRIWKRGVYKRMKNDFNGWKKLELVIYIQDSMLNYNTICLSTLAHSSHSTQSRRFSERPRTIQKCHYKSLMASKRIFIQLMNHCSSMGIVLFLPFQSGYLLSLIINAARQPFCNPFSSRLYLLSLSKGALRQGVTHKKFHWNALLKDNGKILSFEERNEVKT